MKCLGGVCLMGMTLLTCADVVGRYLGHPILGSVEVVGFMATVTACTAFWAVCGSSPATAATMATVGLPEMKRYHYADELSAGSVASGGGLGMIMPGPRKSGHGPSNARPSPAECTSMTLFFWWKSRIWNPVKSSMNPGVAAKWSSPHWIDPPNRVFASMPRISSNGIPYRILRLRPSAQV